MLVGININFAKFILDSAKDLTPLNSKQSFQICSLGWPDLLFTPADAEKQLSNLFNDETPKELNFSESARIKDYHGLRFDGNLACPKWFFSSLNAKLVVLDIKVLHGEELIADLGAPNSVDPLKESFDLVIDNGTIEHIFNIPQAMSNIASLVRLGGVVVHSNPFLMPNHGFWSINPTMYFDFYESNGFKLETVLIVSNYNDKRISLSREQFYKRFRFGKIEECCIWTVAKRLSRVENQFVFPTQTKYRQMLST
jgi:SAM-dependent methyltransferase